jgi:polyisoprenoid-binding protein YceI
MNRRVSLLVVLAGLLLTACANPATNQPKATTSEAAPVSQPAAAGEAYKITPENSKIEFTGSKVTGSHNGAFQKFTGGINYAGAPEKSAVKIAIEMNSVTTDAPDLTKHLQTPDFFDVQKFPQASFMSTDIKPGGEKGATHTITGNLTLHGVTKAITFPATITVSPGVINVDSSFAINRKDFGIVYAGAANNLIRDEVVLALHVKATK